MSEKERLAEFSAALPPIPAPVSKEEFAALDRLIAVAKKGSGQSEMVAKFLLSWWNEANGFFDLRTFWGVDWAINRDMLVVMGVIARHASYPDALLPKGTEAHSRLTQDFEAIWEKWGRR